MSKFTPGPWKVDTAENYDERYIAITNKRDNVVVWWSVPPENFDNDLANANLIAAAPDLYELVRWKLIEGGCGLDWGEKARAALAKANGEVEK